MPKVPSLFRQRRSTIARFSGPIELIPVELLVRMFCFVNAVTQKRLERVCRLWKDVLRSPAVRSVVWIDLGPRWTQLIDPNSQYPYAFLGKLVSEHTKTIVFAGRNGHEDLFSPDARNWKEGDTAHVWKLLGQGEGKQKKTIIFENVSLDLPSLQKASIWNSEKSWNLKGRNLRLTQISSNLKLGGSLRGYFSPGFSVVFGHVKLHFDSMESRRDMEGKIWETIDASCEMSHEEKHDLKRAWGRKNKAEMGAILRLREPSYRKALIDLDRIDWRTLKLSTQLELAACSQERMGLVVDHHHVDDSDDEDETRNVHLYETLSGPTQLRNLNFSPTSC